MTKNPCCRCVLSFCQAIPVIFIILLTFWSYYAYVVVFCIQYAYTLAETVLFLIFYHILFVLFLWSFLKAILTRPIKPPAEYFLSAEDWIQINAGTEEIDRNRYLEALILERRLPIETTNDAGMVRLCPSCSLIKPDRSHHCSTCNTCLLKMDHHCPWIDNCVGFHNYKYFVIFLFWGFLYCLYIVCTTVVYFIDFWENLQNVPITRYNFLFLFFTAIMFGFAQSILLFYHIYLVSINTTTLAVSANIFWERDTDSLHGYCSQGDVESFRSPSFVGIGVDKKGYDLGCVQNFREVFGDNCATALIPIFTSRGNGCQWRRRGHKGFTYQSLD